MSGMTGEYGLARGATATRASEASNGASGAGLRLLSFAACFDVLPKAPPEGNGLLRCFRNDRERLLDLDQLAGVDVVDGRRGANLAEAPFDLVFDPLELRPERHTWIDRHSAAPLR